LDIVQVMAQEYYVDPSWIDDVSSPSHQQPQEYQEKHLCDMDKKMYKVTKNHGYGIVNGE